MQHRWFNHGIMLNDLLVHNRSWAANKVKDDPGYFKRLAALQRPKYLWIGCSESESHITHHSAILKPNYKV